MGAYQPSPLLCRVVAVSGPSTYGDNFAKADIREPSAKIPESRQLSSKSAFSTICWITPQKTPISGR